MGSIGACCQLGRVEISGQSDQYIVPGQNTFCTIENLRQTLLNFFGQKAHFFKLTNVGYENTFIWMKYCLAFSVLHQAKGGMCDT